MIILFLDVPGKWHGKASLSQEMDDRGRPLSSDLLVRFAGVFGLVMCVLDYLDLFWLVGGLVGGFQFVLDLVSFLRHVSIRYPFLGHDPLQPGGTISGTVSITSLHARTPGPPGLRMASPRPIACIYSFLMSRLQDKLLMLKTVVLGWTLKFPYANIMPMLLDIGSKCWLVVWNMDSIFPSIGNFNEFHHPSWRTHIFQRGLFYHQLELYQWHAHL